MQYYDIRKQCEGDLCYDFSNMETFLNKKQVRDALGVGDIDFVSCSSTVYDAMLMDWMRNLEVGIPALLEDGIKVLVYAGEYDLICNWLGEPLCSSKKAHVSCIREDIVLLELLYYDAYLFCREFKLGSCHGMVWSESIRSIINCSIQGWWYRSRTAKKPWSSDFPQGLYLSLSLSSLCL